MPNSAFRPWLLDRRRRYCSSRCHIRWQLLRGRWVRPDGGYVIKLGGAQPDGRLEASHFNPRPINVSRAEWHRSDDELHVFVELREANNPARHTVSAIWGLSTNWRAMSGSSVIEFKVVSLYSPDVADELERGEIDLGFLRVEPRPGVTYQVIASEPVVAIMPSDHRLARRAKINPRDLENEVFIGFSDMPHILRGVVDRYLRKHRVKMTPSQYLLDNAPMGISLVASTRGITLLPAYVEPLLPWSVVSRRLKGEQPVIDLAIGYREDNPSPVLKKFLAGVEWLIEAGPAGLRHDGPAQPSSRRGVE